MLAKLLRVLVRRRPGRIIVPVFDTGGSGKAGVLALLRRDKRQRLVRGSLLLLLLLLLMLLMMLLLLLGERGLILLLLQG